MSNLKKIPLAQTTLSNDFTDNYKSELDSAYQNSHTHTNPTALNNVSGTNTGDETQSTILTKLCARAVLCITSAAIAEKVVTLSGFTLVSGATIQVKFGNTNTAIAPTLNVNSTGAKSIASEDGAVCSSTNPAYFPDGSTVEFTYNGTNWVYKNRIITNYVNGSSYYNIFTNGFIRQGGVFSSNAAVTVNLLKNFKDTNYIISIQPCISQDTTSGAFAQGPDNTNKTTSSFKVFTHSYGQYWYCGSYWQACGY